MEKRSTSVLRRRPQLDPGICEEEQVRNTESRQRRRIDRDVRVEEQVRDTGARKQCRLDPDVRAEEQVRDTGARKQCRLDPDVRAEEQVRNTQSHQHSRQLALQAAIKSKHKLAAPFDVEHFTEGDIPISEKQHVLPGLFDTTICPSCSALKWNEERSGFCCEAGKVSLTQIAEPPEVLRNLYKDSREFMSHIRSYNNALALASLGCTEHVADGYSPTFKIQGKLYHRIGALTPEDPSHAPKFAQIYFHDSDHELENRMIHNQQLSANVLTDLQQLLHNVNPYISSFKAALESTRDVPNVKLLLDAKRRPVLEHTRRYNLPAGSEVAVMFSDDLTNNLDVILESRGGQLQRINELHRSYDPLLYVLLFPFGEDGFTLDLPHSIGHGKVSPQEYARYRLQVRHERFNAIMKSRRLMQQYACDQYCKVEGCRLRWAKLHQKEIRAEKYQGLLDAVDHNDEMRSGMKVILPPTIYGSPRWYAEAFQDSMAIVRSLGKPDLFITFTCNPKWPEIQQSLYPGESAGDRPDISARVFRIKLRSLMDDLTKGHVLGKVVAYFLMKEDQKRGLPHCHILLILSDEDKPRDPQDVDRIVSAEIPDKAVNPRLFEIITKNNIHGPCGLVNRQSPCMNDDGKCEKDFPKAFTKGSMLGEETYPRYRRRSPADGGRTHTINIRRTGQEFAVDNGWVVPYNPLLSLKYNAHVNVEVVHSISAVKYLYKYITKGSDRVVMRLVNGEERDITHDEISRFIDARYVSASEAFWRLYEFPIQLKYPPVAKLPLHLENEETVFFHPENARSAALQGPPITKLTAFFELNKADKFARSVLYTDVYKHYRWVKGQWLRRVSNSRRLRGDDPEGIGLSDTIGRIPVINLSPRQSELFYLRMLLHQSKGATCFADLRNVQGEVHATFKSACLALGLLDDDEEIDKAMTEAASIRIGDQLRQAFASFLMFLHPVDTLGFWERHKLLLAEDITHRAGVKEPDEGILNEVLLQIKTILQRNGYELSKNFGLPEPIPAIPVRYDIPKELEEETGYDVEELKSFMDANLPKLNEEQRRVFDTVLASVNERRGDLFCLDAPGGTGKTFTIQVLLAAIRKEKRVALATAMSGIAATLLPNGRTLHSRCKVPIGIREDSCCSISKGSSLAALVRECRLMIIDEISMCHRHVCEAIDRTFQDVCETTRPFGGVTILFSGDWRQILPVVRRGGRADIIQATLKKSPIWQSVQMLTLKTNMRVSLGGTAEADSDFAQELLSVGEGRFPYSLDVGANKIQLPDKYFFKGNNLKSFCSHIFPRLQTLCHDGLWLSQRAILCPTNEAVEEINEIMIGMFPGQEKIYRSCDKVLDVLTEHLYPVEFLNSICLSGMPSHVIRLKKGCPIMLLRNFDPSHGHCNGTRYIVENLLEHVIEARIAQGVHKGKTLIIPRIPIAPSENIFPFEMQRRQFPIRLCFGMTANKSQGQTLQKVGIYLHQDFFSHGQLYVAMSRASRSSDVSIFQKQKQKEESSYINNIVYNEIF